MATQTRKSIFNRPEKPYVHPYLGGMVLGIVLFLAFFLTGNGLGSSGATSRIDAALVDAVAPSHVDNTPYLLKMAGGDKNPLDDWIVPVFFGALLGGFTSGAFNGRLKFMTTKGPNISNRTRWLMSFLGGVLFLRRTPGTRLYIGSGTLRRRDSCSWLLGDHVRHLRRCLCCCVFCKEIVVVNTTP